MPENAPRIRRISQAPRASAPVPLTLGRYELVEELARGGMARVFLGRHSAEGGFQRLVAIKLLHEHLAEEENYAQRFLDEARWAARIHHPNVVSIVDVGRSGGSYYAAMDYVEGCTLKELLEFHEGDRPVGVLVSILLDMLNGLHCAHTLVGDDGVPLQLIHRDVSPANTLVGLDGVARVSDFGISKARDQGTETAPGVFLGKLAHGAPEQFRGKKADVRSDIFAAGTLMWTALTGQSLFRAETCAATLNNVMQMKVPAPSSTGLRPPRELDAICLKALRRDPDKRFQSAREMADAIRAVALKKRWLASPQEVSEWVWQACSEQVTGRRARLATLSNEASRERAGSGVRRCETAALMRNAARTARDWEGLEEEPPTTVAPPKPRITSQIPGPLPLEADTPVQELAPSAPAPEADAAIAQPSESRARAKRPLHSEANYARALRLSTPRTGDWATRAKWASALAALGTLIALGLWLGRESAAPDSGAVTEAQAAPTVAASAQAEQPQPAPRAARPKAAPAAPPAAEEPAPPEEKADDESVAAASEEWDDEEVDLKVELAEADALDSTESTGERVEAQAPPSSDSLHRRIHWNAKTPRRDAQGQEPLPPNPY